MSSSSSAGAGGSATARATPGATGVTSGDQPSGGGGGGGSSDGRGGRGGCGNVKGVGKLRFTYFDFASGGRGFMVRAALHHAGVEWEDNRLAYPEFAAAKAQGKYATGVPVLETSSGKAYTQSMAMLRFAGKLGGLYPSADLEAALAVDMVLDVVQDAISKSPNHTDPLRKKALREEYAAGKLCSFCGEIDALIAQEDGQFTVGDSFTVADLALFFLTDMTIGGNFDYIPVDFLERWPRITAVHHRIKVHPVVTSWLAQLNENQSRDRGGGRARQ